MNRTFACMLAAVAAGTISQSAKGGSDDCCSAGGLWGPAVGVDAATGRAAAVYPPHLPADFLHVRLDITIPDMNVPRLTATETLTLTPISGPVSTLALDARAMAITSVTSPGRKAEFEYDGKRLTVTLEPPVEPGSRADVVTVYELNDPPLGLIWSPESPAWPGRAAQIHTQGQPETNSYWFPCHDFPNDKLTSEVGVTLPAGYVVSSNGRLESRSRAVVPGDVDGVNSLVAYESWRWVQDKPHAPYLVSLVVGKFDVVDLGSKPVPMQVYVPPGRASDVRPSYGRTPAMIEFFARRLEEPYPWDRYAQVVVWNFGAGGMENTSATTMHEGALASPNSLMDTDLDGLISHELAHQWFGDLTTCNSWEHIWLNEGFATYLTALWYEHRDGPAAYQRNVRGNFDGLADADKPNAPGAVGMVSNIYTHPWEVFRRPANPYGKGSSVLHMLRRRLGDDLFFRGVAQFIDTHKFQTVETNDLRRAFEDVSGQSLEQFFAQWCMRPGVPSLTVKPEWDAATGSLRVTVTQTQNINGENPAYEFVLPVTVRVPGEKALRTVRVPVTGREAAAEFPLPAEPDMVVIDPELDVLAGMTIEQPAARWLSQLADGPTPWSKVQAVRGLRSDTSVRAAERLRRLALDSSQPVWLRIEAVKSLAARDAENDMRSLATAVSDQWEVRLAVVEALPTFARTEAGDPRPGFANTAAHLADRASRDASTRVRAGAIRGLGRIRSADHRKDVEAALSVDSQDDALRQAALEALVWFNDGEALCSAMKLTAPGHASRTRALAAETVGKIGGHDPDAALRLLVDLLGDRDLRTRRGAGDGLVALKDTRAIPALETLAAEARAEEISWQADQWLKSLRAGAK